LDIWKNLIFMVRRAYVVHVSQELRVNWATVCGPPYAIKLVVGHVAHRASNTDPTQAARTLSNKFSVGVVGLSEQTSTENRRCRT
jgi:hypothetical protein